jgi:hypothetical protein
LQHLLEHVSGKSSSNHGPNHFRANVSMTILKRQDGLMTQNQATSPAPIELKPADVTKQRDNGASAAASASVQREAPQGAAEKKAPAEIQAVRQPAPPAPSPAHASAPPMRRRAPIEGQAVAPAEAHPAGPGHAQRQPVPRKPGAPSRARIAANDDMPSIGGLIYALQQRPSRSPFILALLASCVWFVAGVGFSWAIFQDRAMYGWADLLSDPKVILTTAGILVPIAVFWFLAILVWRAQELRLMSTAMTEVAVRLAEPDRMAEQSVASLGQTVRRQVAAMNDAISRALGRAGELEALVHNEVAALERSYTENENRIRNLINELASEREALANNSERVSEALRGVGTQVTREITAASERASQSFGQASAALSDTLSSRGQKITAAVTAAGVAIDEKLAERGTRITEQLIKHGAQAAETMRQSGLEVTRSIQETSDRTAAAISAKGNSLVTSVIGMSERVGREIPALLEKLGAEQTRLGSIIEGAARNLGALETALTEKTHSLGITLADRTKVLHAVLTEQTQAIDSSLASRTQVLETILSRRSQGFEVSLSERTKALELSLAKHAGSIRDTLEKQSSSMEKNISRQAHAIEHVVNSNTQTIQRAVEELAHRSTSGSDALVGQAKLLKDVSATLMGQLGGLTKRFEEQGSAIMSAARTFEVSNSKVDGMIEARQVALGKLLDSINGRAIELDRMMNSYSNMLEQSLSQAELRARKVTEILAKDSAEKSQSAIREIERLRTEAQSHTAKAVSELQANFTSLSDQVSQQLSTLSTRFSETTRTVRDSTTRAASDLENVQTELQRHAKGLPETAKQSASAMRRALQDQLSALDSLSEIASRHSYASAVSSPDRQRPAPGPAPQRERDPLPSGGPAYDYGAPQPDQRWGGVAPASLPTPDQGGAAPQGAFPGAQPGGERKTSWSLGDLLARASEEEPEPFADKDDLSYGMPPIAQPVGSASRGGGFRGQPQQKAPPAIDFSMDDIADCIDEKRVMDIWQRLKRGDSDAMARGVYTQQAQATVDQVRRRYETDPTFQVIVERYLSDFERMLQDLSKSDPKGVAVQQNLASHNGRIYFVLAHMSGRLGG